MLDKISEYDALHQDHMRRLADHGALLASHAAQLKAQASLIDALEESTQAQRRMIEVGETLIQALGWAGALARWITAIAAFGILAKTAIGALLKP